MNTVFVAVVLLSFAFAVVGQLFPDASLGVVAATPMAAVSAAVVEEAGRAVKLALGLVGVMAFFLGLMKMAEAAGLLVIVARLVRPLMQRLFPDVPPDHPAMGSMILNVSANVLGLGNAATPFGIRAMQCLDSLNTRRGTATNAMVLFLAINTSSVTVLPTGVIGLRAAAGSVDPAGIVPTTLFATVCSTIVAIVTVKLLERLSPVSDTPSIKPAALDSPVDAEAPARLSEPTIADIDAGAGPPADPALLEAADRPYPLWASFLALGGVLSLIPLSVWFGRTIADWVIPTLIVAFIGFGLFRRVPIYTTMVEGAREGFDVAIRIIPYLVTILVAIGMFRASGAMEGLIGPLAAISEPFGVPPQALTMALLRALSGSGAFAYLASVINDPAIGPDSYVGYLVSTIQGSTETTFYVLAVYFGAVGVRRFRHAIIAGLTADFAALVAAAFICSRLVGS